MTHRFRTYALIAGCTFSLLACGAHEEDEVPEDLTEESIGEVEQAVEVANLDIYADYEPHVEGGRIHYQSMVNWTADRNHRVEAGVRLQKYQNGQWVVVSPWRNATDTTRPYAEVWANGYSNCVCGTYRGQARGRVLYTGGWSPYEYALGPSNTVTCPNPQ